MSADHPTATSQAASSSNSPPSTFLALLNDNDDDHIANLLAETVPHLTQTAITDLENVPEFSGPSAPPLMPFDGSRSEDGEELLLDPEDWDERRHGEVMWFTDEEMDGGEEAEEEADEGDAEAEGMKVGSSSEECEDDEMLPSFG